MCGFIALFSSSTAWDKDVLKKGSESMINRGPDDDGEWWSDDCFVGMAHRRLAIIDLKRLFSKKSWNKLHLQIIYYGREYCKARECYGITCKICTTCYPNRKNPFKTNKA